MRQKRIDLFLASILLLFLELAFIRWIPANVRTLSYFSNFVLLSCFLGMGIGFMVSLRKFRFITLTPAFLALIALIFFKFSLNMELDPGTFSQSIYYGAEMPILNYLKIGFVPVIIVTTLLICFTFIGLGQSVGYLFDGFAPLEAYLINIGGSIAGTLLFALFSFFEQPPVSWIALSLIILLVLLRGGTKLQTISATILTLVIILLVNAGSATTTWSPYNKIVLQNLNYGRWCIEVNNILHQNALTRRDINYHGYPIPFLLKTRSDYPSIKNVLIIGSGMGNDVATALAGGAEHVDCRRDRSFYT